MLFLDEDTKERINACSQFYTVMEALNGGAVREELDKAVKDCNLAVQDFGGEAKIVLTLKFKRGGKKRDDSTIVIHDQVKVSVPEDDRPETFLFNNATNDLVTQLQKQEPLQLEVAEEKGKVHSLQEAK